MFYQSTLFAAQGVSGGATISPGSKPDLVQTDLCWCDDIENWVQAQKELEETLEFRRVTQTKGSTQWAPVTVPRYKKTSDFEVRLVQRDRYYLVFRHKNRQGWREIYQVGSAHIQDEAKEFDRCCEEVILRDEGYTKRLATNCVTKVGRRTIRELTASNLQTFYERAAGYVSLDGPNQALVTKTAIETMAEGDWHS